MIEQINLFFLDLLNPNILEWSGSIAGIAGSFLLAINKPYSGYGWIAFLVSNICFVGFGLLNQLYGFLLMQCVFMVSTGIGLYRWFEWSGFWFKIKTI